MKKLANHFNAITKNTKARPVLSQVNFNSENQMIECTDSYRLLQVKSKQLIEHTYNLNLITLEMNEGIYPDLKQIVSNKGTNELELNLSKLSKEHVKLLKAYKKEIIHITMDNTRMIFKTDNTSNTLLFEIETNTQTKIDDFSMYFNPIYLFDCLTFLLESEKQNIMFSYHDSNVKPVHFTVENEFNYIITPIKKA